MSKYYVLNDSAAKTAYEAWADAIGDTTPWHGTSERSKGAWREAVDALHARMHEDGECPVCHQSEPEADYLDTEDCQVSP